MAVWYVTDGIYNNVSSIKYNNEDVKQIYKDGKLIYSTFEDCSWDDIINMDSSTAYGMFNVGDEKDITLTNGYTLRVRILGFGQDINADTYKDCKMTLQVVGGTYSYVSNWGSSNSYKNSDIKTFLDGTLYNLFPDNIKNAMISRYRTQYYYLTATSYGQSTTKAKLFPLALCEIFSKTGLENSYYTLIKNSVSQFMQEGFNTTNSQYTYYKNKLGDTTCDYRVTLGEDNLFYYKDYFNNYTLYNGSPCGAFLRSELFNGGRYSLWIAGNIFYPSSGAPNTNSGHRSALICTFAI